MNDYDEQDLAVQDGTWEDWEAIESLDYEPDVWFMISWQNPGTMGARPELLTQGPYWSIDGFCLQLSEPGDNL